IRGIASIIEREHALARANRLPFLDIDSANRGHNLRADLDHVLGRHEPARRIYLGDGPHRGDATSNSDWFFGADSGRGGGTPVPPIPEHSREDENRDGNPETKLAAQAQFPYIGKVTRTSRPRPPGPESSAMVARWRSAM